MALNRKFTLDDNAANTTVVDTSSNAQHGTLNGGDNTSARQTTGPGGSITWAFDFNGTDDNITITSLNATGACSFSMWFKIDALGGGLLGSTLSNVFIRPATDTTIIFDTAGTDSTFTVPSMGTTNWHHLLITRDGSNNLRCFLDGVESSTGALTNSSAFQAIRIGSRASIFFDGKISQVRIYDSDESSNVGALYAEGLGGGGVGLLQRLRMHQSMMGGGMQDMRGGLV